MIVKLLAEHHLVFLNFKRGCTGSSEYILVKMPHCWKSHVMAHFRTRNCQFLRSKAYDSNQQVAALRLCNNFWNARVSFIS